MSVRRITSAAAALGLSVALSLGVVIWYAEVHQRPATGVLAGLLRITLWVWPTAIMNVPDGLGVACDFWGCVTLLLLSAIANAALYGAVAYIFCHVWKRVELLRRPAA